MPDRLLLLFRNIIFYMAAMLLSVAFLLATPLIVLPLRVGWPVVKAYLHSILFLLKHICGLTFEVMGAPNMPAGPVLIAAAHQSTWENLFFQVIFDNPAILIKEEILRYPLVGAIVKKNAHIPAHRSGDVQAVKLSFEEARRQARAGRSILIFPSGTRSGTADMPPLRRGVCALYGRLELPCVPVAHNSGLYWQNKSWLRHPGRIIVEILEPIPAGLEKEVFLRQLTEQLVDGTDRLLHPADKPVLMPLLSPRARRIHAEMLPMEKAGRE
ncbi:putative 1-acyl-sn-glycerol-3-phosphate acyltransferase [Pseudorhizobium banfieldiae]|uniref:Putative 1-acyl-sn-glycerol-3-phosphate acyltransferase n=1 Tax=Pseudorhizobium banfieldiae TaxID=1125847 RepID=L0NBY5_9HYPH|nr:lysophospholipid acyltransferase family protein [Pseudorhizobium banfieldiae]CAD6601876.1 1-acyl-sn-glycerol-3-phosphate acyltransferase [arsenite-oxidising bacterium NT-25]CCF18306.1 putative 1-acyl-sn-glycerol-3-phosphate acyltransferase [Pseudorhizobium banfieldiae]